MSASRVFATFKRPATKDEIAAHLADEAITELEALRKGREDQPHTPQEREIMERLAVLMIGPRKEAVIPVVKTRMPQMAMLLERTVGMFVNGAIQGIDGKTYAVVLGPDEPTVAEGARVAFLPTDDGMARNLQVIT